MSIATEITRLQGIKTDIRTALVTQGIAQAISHNMVDFSSDILAIQGGSEGVYITVTCDSAYQGYDIILSANELEIDRKQCPSSLEVNFFVSADDVTLPTTFSIGNSFSPKVITVEADMYGWYNTNLIREFIALVPIMSSNTTRADGVTPSGVVYADTEFSPYYAWLAFTDSEHKPTYQYWSSASGQSNSILQYTFVKPVCIKKVSYQFSTNASGTYYDVSADVEIFVNGEWKKVATISATQAQYYDSLSTDITNDVYSSQVRIKYHNSNKSYNSNYYCTMAQLQFYGYE